MAERLAEIDAKLVREELEEATHTNEKIPDHIKKVITSPKTMGRFYVCLALSVCLITTRIRGMRWGYRFYEGRKARLFQSF
ncbi:MAG: hypothetical protein GY801_33280 [bacterium]|nr:hypothetical protein [bacterium]